MGEKIKDLSEFSIANKEIKIELNDGYSTEYSKYDIHIQSDRLQYNLSEQEFMKFVSIVITAKRNIDYLKGKKKKSSVIDIKDIER